MALSDATPLALHPERPPIWTRDLGIPRWVPVVPLATGLFSIGGLDVVQYSLFRFAWWLVNVTVRAEYLAGLGG
jgi:hypothetical protein